MRSDRGGSCHSVENRGSPAAGVARDWVRHSHPHMTRDLLAFRSFTTDRRNEPTYFYLYVMLDAFSRYVVGWMTAHREGATLAERFIL